MNGDCDPIYIAARRVLLDALQALGPQIQAAVLVGAQAVYLRVGDDDGIAVAPYTKDADLAINPTLLASEPKLAEALEQAGFVRGQQPGIWRGPNASTIDLIVPKSLGGPGRRAARLGDHGKSVALKAHGVEGALVDNDVMVIKALDPSDERVQEFRVAGPAALLVSKVTKISERLGDNPKRLNDKDALDVFRLIRAVSMEDLAIRIQRLLTHDLSYAVTHDALGQLNVLFGRIDAQGIKMLARSVAALEDQELISQSCILLVTELEETIRKHR